MNPQEKIIIASKAGLSEQKIMIGEHQINFVTGGSGPPMLLLHGANIGWGAWYPNLSCFTEKYTVFAIDLPGCGLSSELDFHFADLEKEWTEVVEKFIFLKGLQKPVLVGHSVGGWVAMRLAIKGIPLSALILESSLGLSRYIPWSFKILAFHPVAKILSRTVMKPTRKNMEDFLKKVMSKSSLLPDELLDYYCQNINREHGSHPFLLLQRLFGINSLRKEFLLKSKIKKINCPVLFISGDQDPLIPPAKIISTIQLFPNSKHEIFSSTGHIPSLEKSEKFNLVVSDFLQRIAA